MSDMKKMIIVIAVCGVLGAVIGAVVRFVQDKHDKGTEASVKTFCIMQEGKQVCVPDLTGTWRRESDGETANLRMIRVTLDPGRISFDLDRDRVPDDTDECPKVVGTIEKRGCP